MKNTLFFLKVKRMGKFYAPNSNMSYNHMNGPDFKRMGKFYAPTPSFADGQVQKRPVGQAWSLSTSTIAMLIGGYQAQPTSHY